MFTTAMDSLAESPYRGRFAPSPTGHLHLGLARTALLAWLRARAAGGRFVLRIEDIDGPRVVKGATEGLLQDLAWLGLDWDEGPDVGGSYGPYVQSQRTELYEAALDRLIAAGRAYACTCSRKEIVASAPHGPSEYGAIYPGTCRKGPTKPLAKAALRFRLEGALESFQDGLRGESIAPEAQGDFVLQRVDGLYSYQLAVVVDDIAMRVSEVVRGRDLAGCTGWQIALYRALDAVPPRFVHVPLLLGPNGVRLAKRDGAVSIAELASRGLAPERVVGWLAASIGLLNKPEAVRAAELIADFSFERVASESVSLAPLAAR